jgi:hypothetical protein
VGIGVSTVTVTVTDLGGNKASCNTTFTVTYTTKPSLSCPTSYNQSTSSQACNAKVPNITALVTASDPCGYTLTQTIAIGSTIPAGSHAVNVTAMDPYGNMNMCTIMLMVIDQTAPVIDCGSVISQAVNNTCQSEVPTMPAPFDNCGVIYTQSPAAGTVVGPGSFNVTINATDFEGT